MNSLALLVRCVEVKLAHNPPMFPMAPKIAVIPNIIEIINTESAIAALIRSSSLG